MKKAQMKIQQMAFMLIGITLLFVLAGIFLLTFKVSELKQEATELEEQNAVLLTTKMANSPEFSCGESFGDSRISCVDSDKVMMLKENIKKYENFWGVSNIEIRKIYPARKELCNIINYPDCGIIKIYEKETNGFDASNFIALCRKESDGNELYNKCELARMFVSYEKK